MQKFIIFFLVIGFVGFVYFSYITVVTKSLKGEAKPVQTETQRILADQKERIDRLNNDYRDIIEHSKRQSIDASRQFDQQTLKRDHDRVMEENRRQIEENRRRMEDLRRDMQRR